MRAGNPAPVWNPGAQLERPTSISTWTRSSCRWKSCSIPSLKGKPVVVGGRPNERGVVSAASYAARKFGVHSAMPLRTAYKLCPQAIFVDGHPERYRDYSHKVYEVLNRFSPLVEMASIDEAYLDMTGTERLHGPPLRAAHMLHERDEGGDAAELLDRHRDLAAGGQDQPPIRPSRTACCGSFPGSEAAFLAPLDVRKVPGVGKVTEKNLHALGIRKVGDLARLDERSSKSASANGAWRWPAKSRGLDAGGWFDTEIGEDDGPKSISHEHTFNEDTADLAQIESTLARLSEMVGRRLREHGLHARTMQLKLRYSDFSTITRAHSIDAAHAARHRDVRADARACSARTGSRARKVRLLGVHASSFGEARRADGSARRGKHERWEQALAAADRLRDKYGESAVSLAAGMRGKFRERTHENPAGLPGKKPTPPAESR